MDPKFGSVEPQLAQDFGTILREQFSDAVTSPTGINWDDKSAEVLNTLQQRGYVIQSHEGSAKR